MELQKKVIEGYEGYYEIHSNGRVYSVLNEMYLFLPKKGNYHLVTLCKNKARKGVSVHRAVAKAFIPNPENKPMVNHKNGIKTDNRVENLEWCTAAENIRHAFLTGLKFIPAGVDNPMYGRVGAKSNKAVKVNKIKDGEVVATYESARQAAMENNVVFSAITNCCSGRSKSCCGFDWEYIKTKK